VQAISGLIGASIWSADLNNLLPFYRDVLGLPAAIETPGFVVLGRRDAPTLALGTHSHVRGPNADPARHMVGRSRHRRRHSGVEATERGRGGVRRFWIATLKDPEGNLIELLQLERTG
jgi:hypothetical protein